MRLNVALYRDYIFVDHVYPDVACYGDISEKVIYGQRMEDWIYYCTGLAQRINRWN